MFLARVIGTKKMKTANQIGDVFTKGFDRIQLENLCLRLGMFDVYQDNIKEGC